MVGSWSVVTFDGPPETAVKSLLAAVANDTHGRPVLETWVGDRLVVTFERTADRSGQFLARVALGVVAAALLAYAGFQMLSLQTSLGNTVAELFDNYAGWACFGLAALSLAYAAGAER